MNLLKNIWGTLSTSLGTFLAIFVLGLVLGITVKVDWTELVEHAIGVDHQDDLHEDEGVDPGALTLSREAFHNLGLELGQPEIRTHIKRLRLPGEVIENPGKSNLIVAAPVSGIISQIFTYPGQAIKVGQPLMKIQVIDESMTNAQRDLLNTISQIRSTESELSRIRPLVANRTVAGKVEIELNYKRDQLLNSKQVKIQELLVLGLSEQHINEIISDQKLIRELDVYLAKPLENQELTKVSTNGSEDPNGEYVFSIERLQSNLGSRIKQGEPLINVSYHNLLYVKTHAFESDIDVVTNNWNSRLGVVVEYGPDENPKIIDGLSIVFADNHVEQPSRTFPFYVALQNSVLSESRAENGAIYRSWLFRPGQQIHVELETERVDGYFVLPASAIAQNGVETIVFKTLDDPARDPEIDFKEINVKVISRDQEVVLVDTSGRLSEKHTIVMKNAHQVQMARKMAAGGGAHHGHEH